MKKNVIELIKILGIGLYELVMDIEVGDVVFNSIEWVREEDKVYLHVFKDGNYDYSYDFDDLTEDQQTIIYYRLYVIYN